MKKLQTKKTKLKSSVTTMNQKKEETKVYASDMGIGFRVVHFRSLSA